MDNLRGADPVGLHEPRQKRCFLRSYRGLIVTLGDGGLPALFAIVLNGLFLPGEQGAGLALPGLRLNGRKGHRMKFPQLFNVLLYPVDGNAAHLHTPNASYGPGSQAEVQQGGGGFGILTEHLKEIAHLKQHDIVGIRLFDLLVAVPPRRAGGFLMLCRLGRGRGFRLQWGGRCRGEQAELPTLVRLGRWPSLICQGAGRSRQPVAGSGRGFGSCALGRGSFALGLFCRLFLLTLRLQDGLRQRSKQGRFSPLIHPHVPEGILHFGIVGRIRREGGEVAQHLVENLLHLFRAVQQGQNVPFRRVKIPLVGIGAVRVRLIVVESVNPPGKCYFLIGRKIRLFLIVEVLPAVNQGSDTLLHLVPVQRDRIIALIAGFLIRTGETDSLGAIVLVIAGIAASTFAIAAFQKISALFGVVALDKIGVYLQLALGNVGASGQQAGDLVLRDEAGLCRGEPLYRLILLFYRR